MRRTRILVLVLTAAAAGCGGGDDGDKGEKPDDKDRIAEEAPVREATFAYMTAVAAGDGGRACGQLTEAAKQDAVETVTAAFSNPPKMSCEQAIKELVTDIDRNRRRAMAQPRIGSVDVKDDRASVEVNGVPGPTRLERVDGIWRIAGSPITG